MAGKGAFHTEGNTQQQRKRFRKRKKKGQEKEGHREQHLAFPRQKGETRMPS